MKNLLERRKNFGVMLAGVGIFYLLALAGTFAVVWQNAAHKTEAMLDYAASDLRDKADEVVDAVLANVGVAVVDHLGSARPMAGDDVRRLAKDYNVDEISVVNRKGIIIASNDPTAEGLDMSRFGATTAGFMVLTNGVTHVYSQKFRRSESNHSVVRKYLGIPFPYGDGYVQVGYDERRLAKLFRQTFGGMLSKWRIGETGFYLCADKAYSLVAVPVPGHPEAFDRNLMDIGMNIFDIPKAENETFVQTIFGKRCYCRHFIYARHRMYSVVPADEFYGPALRTAMVAAAVLLIVFFVFGYVIGRMVSQGRRIAELRTLEDECREKDLAMAKSIQTNALPSHFPPYPKLTDKIDIFARMITAKEVGGDFYDFYFAGSKKLALVIADVSGKGIPAALFMMRAKATIQSHLKSGLGVVEAVETANHRLANDNDANMFVTAWIGVIDLETGEMEYVNAGHNAPLVKRTDGSVEYLRPLSGPPLAVMDDVSYRRQTLSLKPGDGILLYTDGVTEATNRAEALYGEDRLRLTMRGLLGAHDAGTLIDGVLRDVNAFADGAEQADDITLLGFKLVRAWTDTTCSPHGPASAWTRETMV